MQQVTEETDRYISFAGLDCDRNAAHMMAHLADSMHAHAGTPWCRYFEDKLEQRAKMGQDDLHFVGSQINALFEFFEDINNAEALELLDYLEYNCC